MEEVNKKLEINDFDNIEDYISINHIIVESFNGKIIDKICRFKGKEFNKYWLVLNIENNEQYYLIECCGNNLTKIDEESMEKLYQYLKANNLLIES
jgi:hypothetical protein